MRPVRWHPPIELSSGERTIIKHIRRAKLFVFLREHRHEVFDEAFQAALDSSPLWGASRVEDTYNLLGHALRKALDVIADQQGRGLAEIAAKAKAQVVSGSSLKATFSISDEPVSFLLFARA